MVNDARYWREQAALCLDIARQMRDRSAAEQMRASATTYFGRATELEKPADTELEKPADVAVTQSAQKPTIKT